ncbi:LLM class flavin-dependent oxidoreductase [Bradyrhizobium cytisi]|uniref:LLM class flavin-dependent oxidoreductase n=1 Tax=Bradyrhizobium cytisi TaxID=515489 RepID=A0A5S4W0F4_9BRAD|nr:LLM class flavin-dependent oxidoreductase [Bradyrhizobium cytisi]TYL71766.1 LLM class flavin-dependent oxidoreductase [Bradyrhizobium cytisi]
MRFLTAAITFQGAFRDLHRGRISSGSAAQVRVSRLEHDLRYEMTDELMIVAKRLWLSELNFTNEAQLCSLENAFSRAELSSGRSILVIAFTGISYATERSDVMRITSPADDNTRIDALRAHAART